MCPYFVLSRSGFTTILRWITILQKHFSFWVRACLKHACKVFMNIRGNCICINSPKVVFYCNYPFSICYGCHKVCHAPFCCFMASLCSETKILSLSRFSPHHSSWSSGLIKRTHFVFKTCSIQIKSYTSSPKVF